MKQLFSTVVLILAIASCKKNNSSQGKNINDAPKAGIDRFSSSSGHLFVRSGTNNLPAANAPVNMDQAPFITHGFNAGGKTTTYYNLDVQSSTAASIYVFFKSNGATMVSGQHNVIPSKPGDLGYSDFWRVNKVVVPDTYVANSLTNEMAIVASGFPITKTSTIVNCPVVPFGSTAALQFGGGGPQALTTGWYKDSAVAYFNFAEIPITAAPGATVPIDDIYVMFNDNAAGPSSGFKTEPGTTQVHNVIALSPGDPGYSPLWNVKVLDNANFGSVSNLTTAMKATVLNPSAALVNCPVVQ